MIKLNKNCIFYFVLFSFIIEPKIFTQYKTSVLIFSVINIIIFMYLVIYIKEKKYKIPKLLFLWVIYRAYIFILTIINGNFNDFEQWGYLSLLVANLIMVVDYSITKGEDNFNNMLKAGALVSFFYLIINFITLIIYEHGIIPSKDLYSNGDSDMYFLGIKINYTPYIIFAMTMVGAYYNLTKNKKILFYVSMICIITIIYANISTAKICAVTFIMVYVLQKKGIININMKKIIIFTLSINILIIFFNIQTMFSGIIENLLHKNVSLTGRTLIWEYAIDIIKNQNLFELMFGNGVVNHGSFVLFGNTYWPSHNQWIQNIFEVGIIGTAYFCYILKSCYKTDENKSNLNSFLLSVCFAIMLGTVTNQFFGNAPIYIPFVLLYYFKQRDDIEKEKKKGEQNIHLNCEVL